MITSNGRERGYFCWNPAQCKGPKQRLGATCTYIHIKREFPIEIMILFRTLWNRLILLSLVVVCLREKVLIVTFTISLWHVRSDFHFMFIIRIHLGNAFYQLLGRNWKAIIHLTCLYKMKSSSCDYVIQALKN